MVHDRFLVDGDDTHLWNISHHLNDDFFDNHKMKKVSTKIKQIRAMVLTQTKKESL
jgi:hypothetical protein